MLRILNSKERNQAFGKFIFLFLLTILIIIIAVYFNWQMPVKANGVLADQLSVYQTQEEEQQKFTAAMDSAKNLIDSLDKPGVNVSYLNSLIGAQLGKLKEITSQYRNDNIYGDINKKILNVFLIYTDTKTQLLDLKDANSQIGSLTDQLKQCGSERDQAKRDLAIYLRSANAGN